MVDSARIYISCTNNWYQSSIFEFVSFVRSGKRKDTRQKMKKVACSLCNWVLNAVIDKVWWVAAHDEIVGGLG